MENAKLEYGQTEESPRSQLGPDVAALNRMRKGGCGTILEKRGWAEHPTKRQLLTVEGRPMDGRLDDL